MKRISLFVAAIVLLGAAGALAQGVTRYVRYEHQGDVSYGILEGETIHELGGAPFDSPRRTGATRQMRDVRLLAPTAPEKVIAVGFNYKSHLGETPEAEYPGIFSKFPTSLIPDQGVITYYDDATNLHYEGEMVLIIGKTTRNVSAAEAPDHIFAVAPGNDVSERVWQQNDLQWFRAKGADTFGPVGPAMVRGVDYDDLLLETRLNGEVKQSQRTSDLIFGTAAIVSYVSRYVTLRGGRHDLHRHARVDQRHAAGRCRRGRARRGRRAAQHHRPKRRPADRSAIAARPRTARLGGRGAGLWGPR